SKVPLKGIIFSRIAVTAQLAVGAAIVWLLVGISVGILSALRPHTVGDRTAMGLAVLAISMPVFFLGPLALYIFWFKLGWLPGTGYYALGQYGFGTWLSHLILPRGVVVSLALAVWCGARRVRGLLPPPVTLQPDGDDDGGLHPHRPRQGLDRE